VEHKEQGKSKKGMFGLFKMFGGTKKKGSNTINPTDTATSAYTEVPINLTKIEEYKDIQ